MNQASTVQSSEEHTHGPDCQHESEHNVRVVTPNQMRQIKRQQKHLLNLEKKRNERWNQPFAAAKIEDVKYTLLKVNQVLYELEVVRKALYDKGLVTKEEVEAIKQRDKERQTKFEELVANDTMSEAEKRAVAKEYELPLELLGLSEESKTE